MHVNQKNKLHIFTMHSWQRIFAVHTYTALVSPMFGVNNVGYYYVLIVGYEL